METMHYEAFTGADALVELHAILDILGQHTVTVQYNSSYSIYNHFYRYRLYARGGRGLGT